MASTSVVLLWSTWAMMAILRIVWLTVENSFSRVRPARAARSSEMTKIRICRVELQSSFYQQRRCRNLRPVSASAPTRVNCFAMRTAVHDRRLSSSRGTLLALLLMCLLPLAHGAPSKSLRIYSIDVEGGQSTLLVTPSGASLLIDTGWPGNNGRDADRVQAAMRDAGITKLDHLLVTHFHVDHVGGVPELVKRVPIGEFLDHGENREDSDITR